MKKISLILLISLFLLTGCLKRDNLEDIDIYTTVYPTEYITERLYGNHSSVYSIYPDGVNIEEYTLTDKLIKDYSKSSMVIFNGQNNEKDYVLQMYENNKNIKIIDSTMSIEYTNSYQEMWLNPLNFLMMVQNIKTGLKQYINNTYLKNEIDENYEDLKLEISNLDAKIQLMASKASDNNIVVSNSLLKYLEKYDLNVISLDEEDNPTEKTIQSVKNLINNGTIKYIFLLDNEEANDTIKNIIDETGVQILRFQTLTTLTEEQRENGDDYISIMNENIDLLKEEIYE
ncbi:MAG: metal ABC transporter substrate-binding protein [Bacilli bacterium]|nr:metal ABC transporter substrate-binding protein [Bacilli bacterium]